MRLWARARSGTAPARPKRRRVRVPQPYERTFSATVRKAQAPKSSHAMIRAMAGRPWGSPNPIAAVSTCERGDGGAIEKRPVPGRHHCALAPPDLPAGPRSSPMAFKTAPSVIDEHMYRLSRHRHGRVSESAPGPRRFPAAIILRAQCGRRESEVGKWSVERDFGHHGSVAVPGHRAPFVPYVALGVRPLSKDDVGRIQCCRWKILAHSHLATAFCKPRVKGSTTQHLPPKHGNTEAGSV